MNARALVARLLVTVLAAAALVAGPATTSPVPSARAADLSRFDPGMIISDGVFYDAGAMSAAQVQQFLDSKGANCSPTAGNTCLKSFRQTTTTRPADTRCTGTYAGAASETAAQIIAKVASACGINPQVLLVTLQKEQGLVTATAGRSEAVYRKAMGYGCPDTAACDSQYYGFFNQVYSAAKQFKNYQANPSRYGHRAGMVNQVRFHPNAACGASAVYIQNQATAGLYNYTPYQPNAAALAAGYGTGDSCSSYGNRNFWNYFTDWFGSTTQRAPLGAVDAVVSPAVGQIRVTGWAFDPDTTASIDVHVYVDDRPVTAARADGNRPDVGAAYGRGAAHGFSVTVPAAAGAHQVCVFAIDSTGGPNPQIGCGGVTVVNQAPIGSVDAATSPTAASIRVTGWALDPDTTASIRVHVYVDGTFARQVVADGARPDVAAAHGKGAAHGYDVTLPAGDGRHEVCVYALDATGGANPRLGCRTVAVNNTAPIGSVDDASSVEGRLRVRGWVLDPDTTASIRADVYVDGTFARAVTATGSRPDVAAAYGRGAAHGFDVTVPASAGRHEVCVYAIDPVSGPHPRVGCRTVTVVNAAPIGAVDPGLTGLGQITVEGWALDPDTTGPVAAHVYVDGVFATGGPATLARPDVAAAYGRSEHGYSFTVPAATGPHEVCVFGIDSWGGPSSRIGCRTIESNGTPFGALDRVDPVPAGTTAGATPGVRVQGWAIDPNTTAPIRVHVYVDGVARASVEAGVSRPDVAAAHGKGAEHGYDATVRGLAPGAHEVCVWAIDTFGPAMGGVNPRLGCQTVTVP